MLRNRLVGAALVLAAAGVLWLGLFPAGFTAAVQQAARQAAAAVR